MAAPTGNPTQLLGELEIAKAGPRLDQKGRPAGVWQDPDPRESRPEGGGCCSYSSMGTGTRVVVAMVGGTPPGTARGWKEGWGQVAVLLPHQGLVNICRQTALAPRASPSEASLNTVSASDR